MPRLHTRDRAAASSFVSARPTIRYFIVRRQDVWAIRFDGEDYGPYISEREAKLFAIDAAQKLAELGEQTEVLVTDERGECTPAWVHGQDPYPPRE